MTTATLLLLAIATGVPVDVTTLDGGHSSGNLTSLTAESIEVALDGETVTLDTDNLHQLRFGEGVSKSVRRSSAIELYLVDGSELSLSEIVVTSRSAEVTSELLGQLEFPKTSLRGVRLSKTDSKVQSRWNELLAHESRDDMVVVRKGDALDHIEGVVSSIDKEAVKLLLEGSPVPIARARVFGIIFAGSNNTSGQSAKARIDFKSGDRLMISSVSLDGDSIMAETQSGPRVTLSPRDLASIDFSLGKIQYLSDVEPTRVVYPEEHPLFLRDVWRYRRGQNSYGQPLRVGGKTSDRGLWVHSGTSLTYRLGRKYRRLRTMMGIDEEIGDCHPSVGVVIRGDGRELLSETITRGDDVRDIDLDVSGIRELEIEVISTDPNGICEHLDLADVRVIQ